MKSKFIVTWFHDLYRVRCVRVAKDLSGLLNVLKQRSYQKHKSIYLHIADVPAGSDSFLVIREVEKFLTELKEIERTKNVKHSH